MNAEQLKQADDANAEGAWLDLVAAFSREVTEVTKDDTIVRLLTSITFAPLPLPAPKPTRRERVARFILRRF